MERTLAGVRRAGSIHPVGKLWEGRKAERVRLASVAAADAGLYFPRGKRMEKMFGAISNSNKATSPRVSILSSPLAIRRPLCENKTHLSLMMP